LADPSPKTVKIARIRLSVPVKPGPLARALPVTQGIL
jgi:hypothetical protein